MGTIMKKHCLLAVFLTILCLPFSANAGHLFTQASANTPISLNSGYGIQITQLTYEGVGTAGNISLNFNGDWGAGDAIKITIGSWSRTLSYSTPLTGTTQTNSALVVNDPTLSAAGIAKSASMQWTVIAESGAFTFTGYRIYVSDGTFNGTGAAPINQSQVVTASNLGGGTYRASTNSTNAGLGNMLDALGNNATGQLADVMTAVSAMTSQSKELALKLMAPETSQAVGHSAVSTAIAALDTVQVRLDSIRSGIGLDNRAHRGAESVDDKVAEASVRAAKLASWSDSSDAEGMSSGNDALNKHVWLKAFGGKSEHDAKGGFAGSDDHIYGTMVGYDTTASGGWLVGGAFGYARTNVVMNDYRGGDGADIDTYQLTGYFGRSFDGWYLNGMVTYAVQDYLTTRNTQMTGTAVGDFSGNLFGLRVLAGYPISYGERLTVTPFGGVEVNRIRQEAYTETGAGALNLNVAANAVYRVRSILGSEVATLTKLDNGGVLRPSVKFQWRHEFNDDGVNTTTSLVGGGGQFETIGQNIDRDVYGVSGRLNWERSEFMNVAVELGVEAASDYRSYSGQVMAGWRF